jgi:hypothetical protein
MARQTTVILVLRGALAEAGTITMKEVCLLALTVFSLTSCVFGQSNPPTFKTEVESAFIWGEDSPTGAVSSTLQDPRTGNAVRKLSYGGIEVSSQIGFEHVSAYEVGIFLNYTTTIINSTDSKVSVRYGGINVDGHSAEPLWVVPPGKKLSRRERKSKQDLADLSKMHCFTSGFLSSANVLSANSSSQPITVAPGTASTVSSVIRDPRSYHAMLCSVEGCYPTGMIRYYLTINSQDYVFVWPGRSAVYCGK